MQYTFNAAALWTPECGVTANVKKLAGRMKKPLLNATLMEKKKSAHEPELQNKTCIGSITP